MIDRIIVGFRFLQGYAEQLWKNLNSNALQFERTKDVLLVCAVLAGILAMVVAVRAFSKKTSGGARVAFPAFLRRRRSSFGRRIIFGGVAAFVLAGATLYAVALSDPFERFAKQGVLHQGRRIILCVDYSGSMSGTFISDPKKLRKTEGSYYYTSMAAAERFVELRMKGGYKDHIGIVIFADQSYTVAPFTSDYGNLLMSLRLLTDTTVKSRMGSGGTYIMRGINEGVELFRNFDLLGTSGNAFIILSDGEDTAVLDGVVKLDDVLMRARENNLPVYFVQTGGSQYVSSSLWVDAARKTGGEAYIGSDEESLIAAIDDIDKKATGTIRSLEYGVRVPRYEIFTLGAIAFWIVVLALVTGSRRFRVFP